MRLNRSVSLPSVLWLALGLSAGCDDSPTGSQPPLDSGFAEATAGDFAQRVEVTPSNPAPGEHILISSEVVSHGSTARQVTSRICGLDLESELELSGSLLACAGYSRSGRLDPGDTLKSFDAVLVTGAPGEYTLRVRHLLEPEVWVSVPLTVTAATDG